MNNLDLLNPPKWYTITCPNCSCVVLVECDPYHDYSYCNKCSASFQMNGYIFSFEINNFTASISSNLSYYSFINGTKVSLIIYFYMNGENIYYSSIDACNISSYEQINKISLDLIKKYLDNIIFE